MLKANGADEVIIDDGCDAGKIEEKFDKVLELVGTVTLGDSLQSVKEGGSVCMSGMVGDKWTMENFTPMDAIPSQVSLTTYGGGPKQVMVTPFPDLAEEVKSGKIKIVFGKLFKIDEIAEAHRVTEDNSAGGKIVILT
jgi:NADPH:quinone reductase-like Zn-dependent oxidoreductase